MQRVREPRAWEPDLLCRIAHRGAAQGMILALLVVTQGCQVPAAHPLHPLVKIETNLGRIVVRLDAQHAPMTVTRFVEYAQDGYYDGTVFHRVIDGALIQGGQYLADMTQRTAGLRPGVVDESSSGLHNVRGAIALVRVPDRPNLPMPQFFINLADNPALDTAHGGGDTNTVFGEVIEGMETVDRIGKTPCGANPKYAAGRLAVVPVQPVVMRSVRLITPFDPQDAQAVVDAAHAQARRKQQEAQEAKQRAVAERIAEIEALYGRMTTTESGLKYVDIRKGFGAKPMIDDTVEIHYRVELLDHTVADDSYEGDPKISEVRRMKPGVKEGLLTMREGGKRYLVVPSELAFGKDGVPKLIPPDAILFYEIELLAVK